jgi:hypothetical protein
MKNKKIKFILFNLYLLNIYINERFIFETMKVYIKKDNYSSK